MTSQDAVSRLRALRPDSEECCPHPGHGLGQGCWSTEHTRNDTLEKLDDVID